MMRCKGRPRRVMAARDFEADRGAGPKTPPGEPVLRRTVDPIRLQPILNILVTSDGYELELVTTYRPRQSSATNLRYSAIHNATVFIKHNRLRRFTHERCGNPSRECHSELLTRREDMERPQPGGRRRETYRG